MKEVNSHQIERLQFIDWCLHYLGKARKLDLCRHFGISPAAATRDFSLYKKMHPGSITLDMAQKTYIPAPEYRPKHKFTLDKVFYWLEKTGLTNGIAPLLPVEKLTIPYSPNLGDIAALSCAIHQKRMVNISYLSPNSGSRKRDIFPFALVNNALRWHVRAYDMYRRRFIDFVLGRIDAVEMSETSVPPEADPQKDEEWNNIISLELRPHPGNIRHPDAIEREYGMTDHKLRISVRDALAGYLLRAWNVDCTANHSLKGAAYHLWLANRKTLGDVNSLNLAPGMETEGNR